MITLRKAKDRGFTERRWLQSWHTFSFGGYRDPEHMGFHSLRVINEDIISCGSGFETHPHRDMEILTYVLDGVLEHRDSMGNTSRIFPGDVQRMSAGTGVTHSEHNPSNTEKCHLLQIWIFPNQKGVSPSYEQRSFQERDKNGKFCLVASKTGKDQSVSLNQFVDIYAALIDGEQEILINEQDGPIFGHIVRGNLLINDIKMEAGDGFSTMNGNNLFFHRGEKAEVLLFNFSQPD